MKPWPQFQGISRHAAAVHARHNRSLAVRLAIARRAHRVAQDALWVAATKGGVA